MKGLLLALCYELFHPSKGPHWLHCSPPLLFLNHLLLCIHPMNIQKCFSLSHLKTNKQAIHLLLWNLSYSSPPLLSLSTRGCGGSTYTTPISCHPCSLLHLLKSGLIITTPPKELLWKALWTSFHVSKSNGYILVPTHMAFLETFVIFPNFCDCGWLFYDFSISFF